MGVRGDVVLQSMVVEDLVLVREVQAEHLRVAASSREAGLDVGAGELRAEGDYEAIDRRVLLGLGADGVEVEHVPLPVLQRDVAQVRALPNVKLDGPVGEGWVLAVSAGVLVYVSDASALLDHYQGAGHDRTDNVEPTITLYRQLHIDPARHVQERPPGKRRRTQCRKLVVVAWHE